MTKYLQTTLFMLATAMLISAVKAEELERTIAVSGTGSVSAVPDVAVVHAGVVTQSRNAGEALNANNAAMENIFSTLKQFGIEDKHIQTSGFGIHPEYDRSNKLSKSNQYKIIGYQVNNQLQIKIHKLAIFGDVLDALVRVGSNQISGVSFTNDNIDALMNEARKLAVADAKARAELYAQAAGVSLGEVISINEGHIAQPVARYQRGVAMSMAESSVPIASGENEISAQVSVIYAIAD